jgi:SNW domain-containing protein 1
MASLFLPAPVRNKTRQTSSNNNSASAGSSTALTTTAKRPQAGAGASANKTPKARAPSYEQRVRAAAEFSKLTPAQRKNRKPLFVPRSLADFDDGGSFPEIHVAQYPKNMANPHMNRKRAAAAGGKGNVGAGSSSATTRALANVQIDADGKKDYTSLITSGTNKDKKVYAHHNDLKGYNPTSEELALPSQEDEMSTAAKTQAAIDAVLSTKIAMSKPSGTALTNANTSKNQEEKTQFIEYNPNPSAPGYNPTAAKRVIQMVPAQLDPMMPPKHKHTKAPAGPADDFVPVLHAPPEKLTKEERAAWNIPACISNWKNTRGYTIPLDKRLAADGRGLRDDTTINSNFATLSESLYLAERQAREEVRLRALVSKRQSENEAERRERELRELAMQARMDRGGVQDLQQRAERVQPQTSRPAEEEESVIPSGRASRIRNDNNNNDSDNDHDSDDGGDANVVPDEDTVDAEYEKRERIRDARRQERERELRMERHKPVHARGEEEDEEVAIKKARLGDRDVSEKIALGVHTGGAGNAGIDSRLYSQNAGMDSGFGHDDDYNTYSKPMFDRAGVTSSSIYRPTRGEGAMDADDMYDKLKSGATSKFQPDKGFAGAEGGSGVSGGPRSAPVQFEKGGSK